MDLQWDFWKWYLQWENQWRFFYGIFVYGIFLWDFSMEIFENQWVFSMGFLKMNGDFWNQWRFLKMIFAMGFAMGKIVWWFLKMNGKNSRWFLKMIFAMGFWKWMESFFNGIFLWRFLKMIFAMGFWKSMESFFNVCVLLKNCQWRFSMWIFGGDGFDDDDDECGLLIGGMNDGG